MGIPTWGKEVLKRQDEQAAKLGEHTGKLDEHAAKLDLLNAKVDKLTVTVERHDAFHADLMVFLREQFDEVRRHVDVVFENTKSDQRAFGEQQRVPGGLNSSKRAKRS